jgi:hypothetical protein
MQVEQDVAHMVREQFSKIPEVAAIYEGTEEGELAYWVFTSNPQYDDLLMDRLLAEEEHVLDAYPGRWLSFQYIPTIVCSSYREVTPSDATSIFQR